MLKNSYKIILIKEGKYNLKQFNVSFLHLAITFIFLFFSGFGLVLFFSHQLSIWSGTSEIQKHQVNNQIIIDNYDDDKKLIDSLLEQLEYIKKQDDILRRLVKLPPIHEDIRKMGFGGIDNINKINELNYLLPIHNVDFDSMNENLDRIHRLIKLELLSYEEINNRVEENKEIILAYPAIYPVLNGAENLSSDFGYRRDPFSNKHKFHDGHDFSSRYGSDVFSTANGRVRISKYWGSFGNYIEIDHGNGYVSAYGHLSTRDVKIGDKVIRGQKIGKVGNTGRSTAPHLHYEIKYRNKAIDPSEFYFDISMN